MMVIIIIRGKKRWGIRGKVGELGIMIKIKMNMSK